MTPAVTICKSFRATNGAVQNRVLAFTSYKFYTSTAPTYTNLTCGTTSVTVPAGKTGLVTVRADGTVICSLGTASGIAWCLGRVLIKGAEALPLTDPNGSDAWAYINSGTREISHGSFTRTAVVSCPRTHHGRCSFPVAVQAATSVAGMTLEIGKTTVDAEVVYH